MIPSTSVQLSWLENIQYNYKTAGVKPCSLSSAFPANPEPSQSPQPGFTSTLILIPG